MYQTKVLNETDMGGLKSKFQVALLHGPLDDKIQAQLDNDVKNFNKDVARERIRSSNQTLSNILNKREGAPTIESWLKNVYPQYRRDLDLLGDPTGVWDKVAQQMEGVLNETTSKAEAQQVYTGILNAIKNVDLITPAAPKGSPLHKLYQSKFSEDRFTKKFKLQMDLLDKKASDTRVDVPDGITTIVEEWKTHEKLGEKGTRFSQFENQVSFCLYCIDKWMKNDPIKKLGNNWKETASKYKDSGVASLERALNL